MVSQSEYTHAQGDGRLIFFLLSLLKKKQNDVADHAVDL